MGNGYRELVHRSVLDCVALAETGQPNQARHFERHNLGRTGPELIDGNCAGLLEAQGRTAGADQCRINALHTSYLRNLSRHD
jgi:hypothetical protein